MDEYIEREALIDEILSEPPDAHYPSWFADIIKKQPTADVVPRAEVEMMFAEIEEIFIKRIDFYKDLKLDSTFNDKKYAETMITNCKIYLQEIDYLKKKYTEETT